jgi:hypothetical protein
MVAQEFVVDQGSATLGSYPSYGLPLDHYSLNKFASPDDGNFKWVQAEIQKLYICALDRVASLASSSRDRSSNAVRSDLYRYMAPEKAAKVSLLL